MSISEERLKILNLIQEGKITPQEGLTLLEDLSKLEESTNKLEASLKSIKNGIKGAVKKAGKTEPSMGDEKPLDKEALKAEIRESVKESKSAARDIVKEARKISEELHHSRIHEAEELKKSLGTASSRGPRYFHLQVTDTHTGKSRVDVRMPVGLVTAGVKLGAHFSPELHGMDTQHLIEMINEGESGNVIDVIDDDDCEHVVVTLE